MITLLCVLHLAKLFICRCARYPDNVNIARITCTINPYECVCNIHFSVDAYRRTTRTSGNHLVSSNGDAFNPIGSAFLNAGISDVRATEPWLISCSHRVPSFSGYREEKTAVREKPPFSSLVTQFQRKYYSTLSKICCVSSPPMLGSLSFSPFCLSLSRIESSWYRPSHRQRNGRNLWYTITKERKLITGVWSNIIWEFTHARNI